MDGALAESMFSRLNQTVEAMKAIAGKHQALMKENSRLSKDLQVCKMRIDELEVENTDLQEQIHFLESVMSFDNLDKPEQGLFNHKQLQAATEKGQAPFRKFQSMPQGAKNNEWVDQILYFLDFEQEIKF